MTSTVEFLSSDPLVNGKSMTTNPERIFRLDRDISKIKPHKKTPRVREFLQYCRFLTGVVSVCEKPPITFNQILTNIRKDRIELVPKGYSLAISTNWHLCYNAAIALKQNKMKKENSMTKLIDKIKNFNPEDKRVQRGYEKLECEFKLAIEGRHLECEDGYDVGSKLNNLQRLNIAIQDENLEDQKRYFEKVKPSGYLLWLKMPEIHDYVSKRGEPGLIRIDALEEDLRTYLSKQQRASKGTLKKKSTKVETTKATKKEKVTISDTLTLLIATIKKAGAKEVVIKF